MGNINSGKRMYDIDKGFFKIWNSRMAYILGFTCADGNVYNRTLAWDLSNKFESNLDLLKKFNHALHSNYPIVARRFSYRLKISNPIILRDIKNLGIIPNKTKILLFPKVPDEYLRHFIRGFLDGDGWVVTRIRQDKYNEICVGFSNGSYDFMNGLIQVFKYELGLFDFNLRCREKRTKYDRISKTYQLEFYAGNANKILSFLYANLSKEDLFLKRKYDKYLEAMTLFNQTEKIKVFGRRWIDTENIHGEKIDILLKKSLIEDKILPKDIAVNLGVSLSTIYRWLDKSGGRVLERRGSEEWCRRIISSKEIIKNVE